MARVVKPRSCYPVNNRLSTSLALDAVSATVRIRRDSFCSINGKFQVPALPGWCPHSSHQVCIFPRGLFRGKGCDDHRRAKGWADMCRPAVQSSYGVSYTKRARQDHGEFFAGYASCYALSCLALQCVSARNLDTDVLGPSEACEHMMLPGEVRLTSTDIIILPAKNHSLRTDTGGLPKFSLECHTAEESSCCWIASIEPARRPVTLPQIHDTSPSAVTA